MKSSMDQKSRRTKTIANGITHRFALKSLRAFAFCLVLMMLSACGRLELGLTENTNLPSVSETELSGTVEGVQNSSSTSLFGKVVSKTRSALSQLLANSKVSASAVAVTCNSPRAELYEINASGTKASTPSASTAVASDGSYVFRNLSFDGVKFVSSSSANKAYFIEILGCDQPLARVVTGKSQQAINIGTSLVSFIVDSTEGSAVLSASKDAIEALHAALQNATTIAAAYTMLTSNTELRTAFESAFNVQPTILRDAAPRLTNLTEPSAQVNELSALSVEATAEHWDTAFIFAHEWQLDGVPISSSSSAHWTPSANAQGTHTLRLRVGRNDGTNGIDTTKPYVERQWTISVANTTPATAPALSLVGAPTTNNRYITLSIETGAVQNNVLANCASFSSLAIMESDDSSPVTTSPTSSSAFDITCTTAGTQSISHQLSASEGAKTIRLWARDAAGNVSLTPSIVHVIYSTVGPMITVASPASGTATNSTLTISGTCDSAAGSVSITGSLASSPQTASCTAGAYSATLNFSSGDGTKNIAVTQTDNFNNTGSATASFVLDSVAPTITLATTAPSNTKTSPIPFTVAASEPVSGIDESKISVTGGSLLNAGSAVSGTGTSFSFSVTPSGQGSVSVSLQAGAAHDSAGNSSPSSNSISRTYDSIAPTVTIARSNGQNAITNTLPIRFTVNFSEPLLVGRLDVSDFNLSGTAATGAAWDLSTADNQTFTLSVTSSTLSTGTFVIGLSSDRAEDAAGNRNSAAPVSSTVSYDGAVPVLSGLTVNPASPSQNPRPTVSGSTEASASVELHTANGCIGTAIATGSANASTGAFALTPSADLGGDASYSLYVKAFDSAGNSTCSTTGLVYLLDRAAPALTITAPANNSSTQGTITLTGDCETGLNVQFAGSGLSVGTALPCSGGAYSQALTLSSGEGAKSFTVTQTDAAGNQTQLSRTLIRDNTAPALTQTALTATSYSNSNSVTFGGSCETGLSIAVKLGASDESTATCASGSWTYTTATQTTDASRTYTFTQSDGAGNTTSPTATWVRDTQSPVVAITAPTASSYVTAANMAALTVSGACSENGRTVNLALVGTTGSAVATPSCTGGAFTSNFDLSSFGEGTVTITANTTDAAGNSATQAQVSITKDTLAPSVTLSGNPSSPSHNTTLAVHVSGSDVSHYKYKVGPAVSTDCTQASGYSTEVTQTTDITDSLSGFVDGTIKLCVIGRDAAGNFQTYASAATASWTKDTAITDFSGLAVAPTSPGKDTKPSVSGTSEGSAVVELYASLACTGPALANGTANASTGAFALAPASSIGSDGLYGFYLKATDLAGNSRCSSSPVVYLLDTVVTDFTALAVSPASPGNVLKPTLSGTSEASATVALFTTNDCSGTALASTTANGSTGGFSLTPSSNIGVDGTYSFYFKATDPAGNTRCSSSSVAYLLDTTAPTVTLTAPTGGEYLQGGSSGAITWTASDVHFSGTPIALEYSLNGGSTWATLASDLANSGSFSWVVPGLNNAQYRVRIKATDQAGNISTSSSTSLTIDSSNPILTLTRPNGGEILKGGSTYTINWTASDTNFGSTPITLSLSSDSGAHWTAVATSIANSGAYSWTVPSVDGSQYRIKVSAQDRVANLSTASSTSDFIIDNTAPSLTLTSLTGGQVLRGNTNYNITWSASDATFDAAPINVELSSNSGATWTALASNLANSGSYTWNVAVSDATTYRVRIKATDQAGNQSIAASTSDFRVLSTAPTLTQTYLSSTVQTTTNSVTFGGACETGLTISITGTDSTSLSCPAGTWSYTTAVQTSDGPRSYTFSQTNGASITSSLTTTWVRDATAPQVTSVSINSGATLTGSAMVNVAVTVSEANMTGLKVRIEPANSTTGDCQSEYGDTNWLSQTNATQTFSILLTSSDGVKKLCAWAKDSAGNVSTIASPSTGTTGVNTASITFSSGNPPQVTAFTVTNDSGSANQGTTTYASGEQVKITWTVTDTEGLDSNPISLDYTTDGSTWIPFESGYGNLSGNPTSYTYTYYGFTAPTSGFFRVRIRAKDLAGNTSPAIISNAQNSGNWTVYAGNRDRGIGGNRKSAIIRKNDGVRNKSFTFDPLTGDLYAFDDTEGGLLKIDAKTGIVSKFIAYGNPTNLPTDGQMPSTPYIYSMSGVLAFDSKRNLYVMEANWNRTTQSARIYQINLATNHVKLYLGGTSALGYDDNATPTSIFVNSTDFDFDESNSLYFFTTCSPGGAWNQSTLATRLMKLTQTSSGDPGTLSVIAGNCTKGTPVSGTAATVTPLSNGNDNLYYSLAVWGNGSYIYYADGGSTVKVINGTSYSTTFGGIYGLYASKSANKLYATDSSTLKEYAANFSGAGGDTLTATIVNSGGTGNCTAEGTPASAACVSVYGSMAFNPQGKLFFGLGNSNSPSRIAYVDDQNKLAVYAGTLPFDGDGKNKSLARGNFGAIYYKKDSEPNQTAFPAGLYFYEQNGVVLGRINDDGQISVVVGNQRLNFVTTAYPTGTAATKDLSLGPSIDNSGRRMTFDSQGLPWFVYVANNRSLLASIDSSNAIVARQTAGSVWDYSATSVEPSNLFMGSYGGFQNLTFKGQALFLYGRHYNPPSQATAGPLLRLLDFTSNVTTHLMGTDSGITSSADTTVPGSLASLSFDSLCQNSKCPIQFIENNPAITSDDILYFSEGTKFRKITDPTTPANSVLTTVFNAFYNLYTFTISPDQSQVFYLINGQLYCHALTPGGAKSWCNDTTLGPNGNLGYVGRGVNQFAWKDNNTLFVSTFGGEIYQFNVPQIP